MAFDSSPLLCWLTLYGPLPYVLHARSKSFRLTRLTRPITSKEPQPKEADQSQPVDMNGRSQQDKVRSTLRMFVRDWSKEVSIAHVIFTEPSSPTSSMLQGEKERLACYQPCLEALDKHFSHVSWGDRLV